MSEPSDTTPTTEPETLRVLSAASRALSNPNLEVRQEYVIRERILKTIKQQNK